MPVASEEAAASCRNPSASEPVHFLQIWIIPAETGLTPGYEQRAFAPEGRRGRLQLVASPDGAEGSLTVHQDVRVYLANVSPGEKIEHAIAPGRGIWLQVARGIAALNGTEMRAGDGAAVQAHSTVTIEADTDSEVLLFDLA